ncbi:MAG: hypothetical protein GY796_00470 [Chloroflexi bacterium]|nr:hypothetical protein [Chloroflexota bacterium]
MHFKKLIFSVGIILILLLVLSGCGISEEKGRKPGPDWSKGLPLSTAVIGTVGMAIENNGEIVHLAWMETVLNDDPQLRYMQMDAQAQPVMEQTLALPHGRVRAPRLLLANNNQLYLFWALRPAGSSGWQLWQATLDDAGNLVDDPQRLSTEEMNVGSYDVAQNFAGASFIVWEENQADQIVGMRVGAVETAQVLVESGESPHIQVDQSSNLHLTWQDGLEIYYAAFEDGDLETVPGTAVAEIRLSQSDSLAGPVIGVSDDWVYFLWSIFSYSGLEANTGQTDFIAFPVGQPQKLNPEKLLLFTLEDMPYVPITNSYNLTQLAPPPPILVMSSNFVLEPSTAAAQGNDLAAVVASMQTYSQQSYVQMVSLLFRDGDLYGYQMASRTQSFSSEGTIATDNAGHLYLTWHEGGSGNRLFYATTQPDAQAAIDQLSLTDVIGVFLSGFLESLAGILLFPLALLWFIPGVFLLGIVRFWRNDESMDMNPSPGWVTLILLFIALALYYATKLSFLPTVLDYVPFSAWLDISLVWQNFLLVAVPIILFGLAVLTAEWIRRKRVSTSVILYFIIICLVDATLTLAVYGVSFMGAF